MIDGDYEVRNLVNEISSLVDDLQGFREFMSNATDELMADEVKISDLNTEISEGQATQRLLADAVELVEKENKELKETLDEWQDAATNTSVALKEALEKLATARAAMEESVTNSKAYASYGVLEDLASDTSYPLEKWLEYN